MPKRKPLSAWTRLLQRSFSAALHAAPPRRAPRRPAPATQRHTDGDWIPGVAMSLGGARRFRLYRPPGVALGERLPLMVMLHGCQQDAEGFAASTRMNRVAREHRFLVLYPEQDRLSNVQGCWNWYETRHGRARTEMGLILKAIDQVCLLYAADRGRVAIAGLSAGASMAALLASHAPERFKAVVMHSGIPPGTASSTTSAMQAMRGRRSTAAAAELAPLNAAAWPALMVIHGGRDKVVAASNGQAAVALWAEAASAVGATPRRVQRGKRHAMQVTDYLQGGTVKASYVEIDALAHAWSGGAKGAHGDPLGPDASRLAWAFAARQFAR